MGIFLRDTYIALVRTEELLKKTGKFFALETTIISTGHSQALGVRSSGLVYRPKRRRSLLVRVFFAVSEPLGRVGTRISSQPVAVGFCLLFANHAAVGLVVTL